MALRLSHLFYDHPDIADVSIGAVGLYVTAGSWLSGWTHKTDYIRTRTVQRVGGTMDQAQELVDAGFWIPVEGGWKMKPHPLWSIENPRTQPQRAPIPDSLRREIYEQYNYQCVVCGTADDLEIDHIHPVSRGGTNDPDNLQAMCGYHNRKKGARVDGLV